MKTLKDIALLIAILGGFALAIALVLLNIAGDVARWITWIKWALA